MRSENDSPLSTVIGNMSAIYDKLGLRFMYPENWEVIDEDPHAEPRTVSVHNDSGAFWAISTYPPGIDPVEISTTALSALRDEYADLEAEHCREDIGPTEATGYDLHFYVQQLLAAARIRVFAHGERLYLMLCQAEDREFEELSPVFQAMTISLLKSVG